MSAESTLLSPEERSSEPTFYPAPWTLQGSGYVVLLRAGALTDQQLFVPPSLAGKRQGQTLSLLFFDYQASVCGPYRELMIGAGFAFDEGHYSSITRAYASTRDSAANSQLNWGLPAEHADFSVERISGKHDQVVVARDGHSIAELDLEHSGLSVPVTTALLPSDLRTMVQHWRGEQYSLALNAKGKMRLAKLRRSSCDPRWFPDVSQASVIAAAYLPSFELKLPRPAVRDI